MTKTETKSNSREEGQTAQAPNINIDNPDDEIDWWGRHRMHHCVRAKAKLKRVSRDDFAWISPCTGQEQEIARRGYHDHDKRPVIGFGGYSRDGRVVGDLIPIYSSSDDFLSLARPGYVLSGIHTCYDEKKLIGIQATYSKIHGGNIDLDDSYQGGWVGVKPNDEHATMYVDCGGRVVHGFYYDVLVHRSIGLFRVQD